MVITTTFCMSFLCLTVREFSSVQSPERLIIEANNVRTGADGLELVRHAFASKRLDLVIACFHVPSLEGTFVQELEKLPDLEFRTRVVLALMEELWPFDNLPDHRPDIGSPPPPRLQRVCIKVLAKKLQAIEIDPAGFGAEYHLLKRSNRLILVELFRLRS